MKKWMKIAVPAICVIVVAVTFYMIFDIKNKIQEGDISSENVNTENTIIEENEVDEENVVEEENTIDTENTVSKEENVVDDDPVLSNGDKDKHSDNNKQKAIDIVKKLWGEDNTIYYTNEGINSKGEYMVAIRDKSTTAVKNYYKVNIETGEAEIDY